MIKLSLILLLFLGHEAHANWNLGVPMIWVKGGEKVGEIMPSASNNNVSIERFENKLFMVWRSSKDHFASEHTWTHVVYSTDEGKTWIKDLSFSIHADVREGLLKMIAGKLHLYYFEGGKKAAAFDPKRVVHRIRSKEGKWSEPTTLAGPAEVVWDIKEHKGKMYKISYEGPHYSIIPGVLKIKFEVSEDGTNWGPVEGAKNSVVYRGGVSEVSLEFDDEGNLFGVGRNEDGDKSGWGTQIFTARAGNLSQWTALKRSLPTRYDSPRMFKHHGELYLLSRKTSQDFDRGYRYLPFNFKRWLYLGLYSLQTIRSGLFRLDPKKLKIDFVLELPSAGDNAFPSVVQTSPDQFLIANYTSPLKHTDWSWIRGQKSEEGTQIYGIPLTWTPELINPSL